MPHQNNFSGAISYNEWVWNNGNRDNFRWPAKEKTETQYANNTNPGYKHTRSDVHHRNTRTQDKPKIAGVSVNDGREPEEFTEEYRKKSAYQVLSKFAGYCTICGVDLIHNANSCKRKTFWVLCFMVMSGFMSYHLYYLSATFFAFEFSTKILLNSGELPFPSVTFCNHNPLRYSKIEMSNGTNLRRFLDGIRKDAELDVSNTNEDSNIEFHEDYTSLNPIPYGEEENDGDKIWTQYYTYISELTIEQRKSLGYDLRTLLMNCKYNGYQCSYSDFHWSYSTEYVNCYTYNSAYLRTKPLTTFHSGGSYGLTLELFADPDEYLVGLIDNAGFRVSVHPFGTLPFPGDVGFSISTGQETRVAIQYKNYTRLNEPYKKCDDGQQFKEVFNQTHSLRACDFTCKDYLVITRCNCKLSYRYEFIPHKAWNMTDNCSTKDDYACASGIIAATLNNSLNCNCTRACNYSTYTTDLSAIQWPNLASYNTMTAKLCELNDSMSCQILKNTSSQVIKNLLLTSYFSKLQIYFKDTMYETSEETISYEAVSYISDIGGTIGLWLGLSLFSIVEVIDLFMSLCRICCHK